MQYQDYQNQVRELVHDLAGTDWTNAELGGFVNNARVRVALDAHCVRAFIPGLSLIANQESYPWSGVIAGYTITNPGTNYTAPIVTVGASQGGGVNATAVAVVASELNSVNPVPGPVTQINPTNWGTLYTAVPTCVISDSGGGVGVGATATPILLNNIIDLVSVTAIWPGALMSRTLQWSPFTEFQAWARSYRGTFGYPAEWSGIQEQNIFFVSRIPDQAYQLELDTIATPNNLVNLTDVDAQIVNPWSDAVQYYAAYLALIKLQNYQHASYFEKWYDRRLKQILATKQTRRIRNVYLATYRRRMRGG